MMVLLLDRNQQFERLTNQIWESQQRPVTKTDFLEKDFVIDGILYERFTEAQFYKCASILQREDKILQLKKTIPAHYYPAAATVKTNHTEVTSSDSPLIAIPNSQRPSPPPSPACTLGASFAIKFIEETVWNEWDLHNIHLAAFNVKDIHPMLKNKGYNLNNQSYDIQLKPINFKGLNIKPTIHRTNTITVSVGCSYAPIIMNGQDVTRLDNGLDQTINNVSTISGLSNIPIANDWLCTEYHYGRDGENLYRGQIFEILWRDAKNTYHHIYSKKHDDGYHLRDETYGYPFTKLEQVLNSKMIVA
jgi:hypothetical protein